MTDDPEQYLPIVDVCAASQTIRLYDEEFEVISDPFPEAGGIAITVRTKKDGGPRVLQIPATILQSVKGSFATAA